MTILSQSKRGKLFVLLALLGIFAATFFAVKLLRPYFANKLATHGELATMMGITEHDPKQLSTYRQTSGVLDIQNWKTPNGVRVYFVEVPTIPMVDIEVIFDAGAARNGNKGALAYLTSNLLSEGTSALSADRVAENFENVGAQFSASSQRDMATVNLRSLSDPKLLAPALETMAAVITEPSFPQAAFERERQNVLIQLKKQAQSPAQLASKAYYSTIFEGHPYSNWVLGDEASVQALTLDDIKQFHQQYYVANNAVVVIVGSVTAPQANAIAEKLTQHLVAGEKPAALPPVASLTKPQSKTIAFPSAQTHILMGEPLIKQGDPDYYALYLANHILGGNGSVSRIFSIIRGQHGLAYSAYSYFQPMKERGPYVLGCQTRTDQADKALALLQTVLQDYVKQGPTEKEFEDAKRNILGGYALQFDSNSAITQQIASLGFYDLPLDYFDNFKGAIEKLTIQDVHKVFQERVSADNVAIIKVGNSEKQG